MGIFARSRSSVPQHCIQYDVIKWNIFRVTGQLWEESIGHWWIPLKTASGAEIFFIWAWTNGWGNNPDAGDLRRHRAHYDATIMIEANIATLSWKPFTQLTSSLVNNPLCDPTYLFDFGLPLLWRHNERDGVSNHRRLDCLFNCFFRHRSQKTSKLRVLGRCEENSPVTGEFYAQKASNAEMVSIGWRHYGYRLVEKKDDRKWLKIRGFQSLYGKQITPLMWNFQFLAESLVSIVLLWWWVDVLILRLKSSQWLLLIFVKFYIQKVRFKVHQTSWRIYVSM